MWFLAAGLSSPAKRELRKLYPDDLEDDSPKRCRMQDVVVELPTELKSVRSSASHASGLKPSDLHF